MTSPAPAGGRTRTPVETGEGGSNQTKALRGNAPFTGDSAVSQSGRTSSRSPGARIWPVTRSESRSPPSAGSRRHEGLGWRPTSNGVCSPIGATHARPTGQHAARFRLDQPTLSETRLDRPNPARPTATRPGPAPGQARHPAKPGLTNRRRARAGPADDATRRPGRPAPCRSDLRPLPREVPTAG
jgi:hypothetical protein